MTETIKEKLREIEQKENIKILLAVESGSRAWGFPSPDSDYDVRFIYVRPKEEYLKLNKGRDVIEYPINNMLDINGWDLDKALKLLFKSNPTLFEWLNSPIVYMQNSDFVNEIKAVYDHYFNTKNSLYHYLSMAQGNYREYLKTNIVKAKKYFYVLRPILCCRWILEHRSAPPMLFSKLIDTQLDKSILPKVEHLLDLKMNSTEVKMIPRIDVINEYIDKSFEELDALVKYADVSTEKNWDELDNLFMKFLI